MNGTRITIGSMGDIDTFVDTLYFMKFYPLILGIILSANTCDELPYRGKIICVGNNSDCTKIKFGNQLELKVLYSDFSSYHKKLEISIVFKLNNSSTTSVVLDRNAFSLVSSDGSIFKLEPMNSIEYGKRVTLPNQYEVAPQVAQDYVFSFFSNEKYSTKQMTEVLKKSTYYFLRTNEKVDTLFTVIADDKRNK